MNLFYPKPMPSTDNDPHVTVNVPAPPSTSLPEAEKPQGSKKAYLDLFCSAIRDFEGSPKNEYGLPDLNYRNNNPGNFRCSPVGYADFYGKVDCVSGFAKFSSYALGWEYLQNSVLYRAKVHPQWTILDFFKQYAPPGDNNPTEKYAQFVAGRCGVSVDSTLAELFG